MAKVFERYRWLADLIRRSGGITLEDIQDAWERSPLNDMHKPLSDRTFHRHKDEIEGQFNICIKCRKPGNEYYIDNEDEVSDGGVTDWMLSTIAVDNMLNESRDLRDRIQFERIPGGREHLSTIINAMRDGIVLSVTYRNFGRAAAQEFTLKPYFLKVYEQRWYVIGVSSKHPDEIRTYALDRITSLSFTDEKFAYPKKFSPESFYANCYGIYHTDEKPTTVRLRVTPVQASYLETLPLHRSQRRVEQESTAEHVVFEYFISRTADFVRYLASKASEIEVLEPEPLRAAVAEEVGKMYRTYFKECENEAL